MNEIIQYLKEHGERVDTEIAAATGLSLKKVRVYLSELAANREIMACHSVKFEKGKKIESVVCRLTGYIPPSPHSKKTRPQLKTS